MWDSLSIHNARLGICRGISSIDSNILDVDQSMNPEQDHDLRRKEVERGGEADRIVNSKLYQETHDLIMKQYWDALINSPVRAAEDREVIIMLAKTAQKYKEHFESVLRTGTLARKQLEDMVKEIREVA